METDEEPASNGHIHTYPHKGAVHELSRSNRDTVERSVDRLIWFQSSVNRLLYALLRVP